MKVLFGMLVFLLFLSSATLAIGEVGETRLTVHVIDVPEPSVSIRQQQEGLNCSWLVDDNDPADTLSAESGWFKDGEHADGLDSAVACEPFKTCYAGRLAPAKPGESWSCHVKVTDSYGTSGEASAGFSIPSGITGFFLSAGGEISAILNSVLEKVSGLIGSFIGKAVGSLV